MQELRQLNPAMRSNNTIATIRTTLSRSPPLPKQYTQLLSNRLLDRLQRSRITPLRKLTNRSPGGHLARKGGASTELADFRDYAPGDDIRFIDWNSFSRLHRPYLKLFHQEEEMHVTVLIDASNSMLFEGKLELARQLAAVFGVLALRNPERLSMHVLGTHASSTQTHLARCAGRANVTKMLAFVEQIDGGGDATFEDCVEAALQHHRGKGVAVLLSDFLTFGDLTRPFNLLFSAGLQPMCIQILAPSEISPDVNGDLRMVDCEQLQSLDVSAAGSLLGIYQEHLQAYQQQLETLCRQRSGQFISTASGTDIDTLVFDTLRRRGWIQ
ncbi:MAG: hypothetical protein ACI9R3_006099 [Verrucomicrobiales bacterium]